jgi:hypothetical protein
LILQTVSFVLDDKVIKEGRIKIFNTKQNFIKFRLETDGEDKEWELTYPYDIRETGNGYIFDYSLSAFCPRTEDAYWKMFLMDRSDSSKMYNNWLYVIPLNS